MKLKTNSNNIVDKCLFFIFLMSFRTEGESEIRRLTVGRSPTAVTQANKITIPFKLEGISSWGQSSFWLRTKWNSIWFIIYRKTVAVIIFHWIWKESEMYFSKRNRTVHFSRNSFEFDWNFVHQPYASRGKGGPIEGPPLNP